MLTGSRAGRGGSPARLSRCWLLLSFFGATLNGIAAERAWTSIGPFGGGSQVVAVDPSAPDRIYTLTSNSFLYRSDDQGQSWRLIRFPAQQAAAAQALVINPSNPQEIWIAVSSGNRSIEGIYRTTNGG